MISLVRVDNRLIHGQVVEAWLPHLDINRVVVGDEEASESPLIRAAMKLAVPSSIPVVIDRLERLSYPSLVADPARTLVLIRDIAGAMAARQMGLAITHLNIGNVHFRSGRRQIAPSVFLSPEELTQLAELHALGVRVEIRSIPSDREIGVPEMLERFEKGT
jgi:PTS system mannose-specific IIB component